MMAVSNRLGLQRKGNLTLIYWLQVSIGIFNLLLLFSLLVLTIVWQKRMNGIHEKEQIICQPCPALRHENSVPLGCKDDGNDTCCCNASVAINSISRMSVKNKFRDYRLRGTASVIRTGCVNQEKAKGKLVSIDFTSLEKDTRERDLVYWNMSNPPILVSVEHTHTDFKINKPGYYYVFSQIKYKHDPEAAQNTESRQSHSLHRYSLRTRLQKLLENTRTYAELHLPTNNGTSFIGADFKFEAGDEIMIKSSHTHSLSGNDRENFFGLFMI